MSFETCSGPDTLEREGTLTHLQYSHTLSFTLARSHFAFIFVSQGESNSALQHIIPATAGLLFLCDTAEKRTRNSLVWHSASHRDEDQSVAGPAPRLAQIPWIMQFDPWRVSAFICMYTQSPWVGPCMQISRRRRSATWANTAVERFFFVHFKLQDRKFESFFFFPSPSICETVLGWCERKTRREKASAENNK